MISCTEFIPAYNELFKFLDQKGGKQAVVAFWEALSDSFLNNLRELVKTKGVAGCFEYWSHTLTEEAADFRMVMDEDACVLRTEMRNCPSKGRLLAEKHIEPYEFYCEHCAVLYRRVLEPLGLQHEKDLSRCHEARCSSIISKKK